MRTYSRHIGRRHFINDLLVLVLRFDTQQSELLGVTRVHSGDLNELLHYVQLRDSSQQTAIRINVAAFSSFILRCHIYIYIYLYYIYMCVCVWPCPAFHWYANAMHETRLKDGSRNVRWSSVHRYDVVAIPLRELCDVIVVLGTIGIFWSKSHRTWLSRRWRMPRTMTDVCVGGRVRWAGAAAHESSGQWPLWVVYTRWLIQIPQTTHNSLPPINAFMRTTNSGYKTRMII